MSWPEKINLVKRATVQDETKTRCVILVVTYEPESHPGHLTHLETGFVCFSDCSFFLRAFLTFHITAYLINSSALPTWSPKTDAEFQRHTTKPPAIWKVYFPVQRVCQLRYFPLVGLVLYQRINHTANHYGSSAARA